MPGSFFDTNVLIYVASGDLEKATCKISAFQTSLRAALFAPGSNPKSAVWTLDCFGAKGAPRNDG